MAELIFACEGSDRVGREYAYRGPQKQEYFEGDYDILPGDKVSVRIEKGLASTCSIINLRSSSPLRFRRNWTHIRQDKTDVTILWFMKRGSMVLSRPGGKSVISPGQCTISRSLQPYQTDSLIGDDTMHEALHVVAPTHLVRSFIPDYVQPGTIFSSHDGDCNLARRTFELLFEEGASVSNKAADGLAREAICAVGSSLMASTQAARPHSLADKRFDDLVSTLQRHLGNPDLSAGMVARACGISPRYLSYILKSHDTSFSDILWASRLERAQAWLVADSMSHLSISEISYMAGFKSPAHFSRMFKSTTRMTPRDFRAAKRPA